MLPSLKPGVALGGVLVGYAANNLLPARLGELVRAQTVGHAQKISRSTVLSSILVERIFDGSALVILLVIGSRALTVPEWYGGVQAMGIFVFASALFGVVFCGRAEGFLRTRLPKGRLGGFIGAVLDGVTSSSRSPFTLLVALGLSVLVWVIEGAMFWYALQSFGLSSSFLVALFVLGIVNLGILVPSSPGYVGVFQYFGVLALGALGVEPNAATAAMIVLHACQYFPATIAGLVAFQRFGVGSFVRLRSEH
jgi:uncharacterized protein (TIRG00374 family)